MSSRTTSLTLATALGLIALIYGLVPGLLAACVGYLAVNWSAGVKLSRGVPARRWRPGLAAGVVIALPLIGLAAFVANAKGVTLSALGQYQDLLHHLASTVLRIREQLPADLAQPLPNEPLEAQTWLAGYLRQQAGALTDMGRDWLHGGLLAYVGLVVGALIASTPRRPTAAPLRSEVRARAATFIGEFRGIVVAQVGIAAFNATCTAVFLFAALPMFDVTLPYSGPLVALTFVAGLIPIAGNLLCNSVLTLVGVSVSPLVGLACLGFLIAIHKFEYVILAKLVGSKTNTATWELLAAMFIGEAIFGVSGLVVAPLYYAYAKRELTQLKLI